MNFLLAASVLGAQSSVDPDIIDWANNTAGRQKWAVELNSTNQQRVVCVHHKPLRMHLSLSVLELFLVQRISTNSSSRLDLSTASEDTWLEGAVGGLDPLQQLERGSFRKNCERAEMGPMAPILETRARNSSLAVLLHA